MEALRGAQTQSVAMDTRGYRRLREPGVPRTWLLPAPWRAADAVMLLGGVLLALRPTLLSTVLPA